MKLLVSACAVIYSALLLQSQLASASQTRIPQELAWFNNSSEQLLALTLAPTECVEPLDDPRYRLGRLAFNSPRLLGGQAGRMGLSCASCHRAGRDNKHFFIQQISDRPGRADISHHFLSSEGGDKVFNPKPIPDLADIETLRFKDRNSIQFDQLLTRLIEIEFDGQPPPRLVFESLKGYLSQVDIQHCKKPFVQIERSFDDDWRLIDDGLSALEYSIVVDDTRTEHFARSSMRSVLESFYRYYSLQPMDTVDNALLDLSRSLRTLPKSGDMVQRQKKFRALSESLDGLKALLKRHQSVSFYNFERAAEYLNRKE